MQDYIETLKSVALAENVENPKVDDFKSSEKGDGYLGEMKFIDITGSNKNLHVILKTSNQTPEVRETMATKEIFQNEILMYTEINPALQKLQEGLAEPFDIAKCYKTSMEPLKEFLILENLKKSGYSMWNRRIPMDRDHIVFTLKQYAKLHASSYVLYQKNPEKLQPVIDVTPKLQDRFLKSEDNKSAYKKIMLSFKETKPKILENKDIEKKFNWLMDNFDELFLEPLPTGEDSVLCHGDCWCNNMMFKYEEGKLVDMKLLDFQVIKFAHPVNDLAYFLYTSTSKDVYDDYEDLLKIYHTTLTEYAKALGHEIPMSFGKLMDYWKRYAKVGFFIAFVINKALLVDDEDEVPDITKAAEDGDEIFGAFNFKGKNDEEYCRRIEVLLQHCYDNDFL